ncbi:putative zinc-binding peptidase [Belnapia sp. T6]|uniref:Zinc-binding peptidase n=1 Tax=Belnapia mucosa TaxID=2804532 RepID=A0ABS1UXL0_9PROT|nr:putative zinc-binding peptidase [Belnapia mucosa]MBL6454202.1 putative zinc-binding peptidase [Belnapia mucosa]
MKLFRCQACSQVLYFENIRCERSHHTLGYMPERFELSALEEDGAAEAGGAVLWQPLAEPEARVRLCANAQCEACNWLIPAESEEQFCDTCRHNRTVPDLTVPENLMAWRRWQSALHRLVYTLRRLGLAVPNRVDAPDHGLVFDVLADPPDGPKVLTGHDEGIITLALSEADDAERERRRTTMGEPYRTLLGHVRHEVGHYYWNLLVRDAGRLEECRAVFGDDSQDYGEALKAHYANGAPADWQDAFVSAYATAHPWEDFAETWAHYLHIVDTLEMAAAFGIRVRPRLPKTPAGTGLPAAEIDFDPYGPIGIEELIENWLPLTYAANSLNRCMGAADLYPFVLSAPAIAKLGYIHHLVRTSRLEAKSGNALQPLGEG